MNQYARFSAITAALVVLSLAPATQAISAEISGVPTIAEGDRIQIGGRRIRLLGIDAPSIDQLCLNAKGEQWTCGIGARDALAQRTKDLPWTCQSTRNDRFGRALARCEVKGEDIQKWMVRSGWALAFTRATRVDTQAAANYQADEAEARKARAGIWAGSFFAPWDWRVRNKKAPLLGAFHAPESARLPLMASASGSHPPSPGCRIKGNVNRSGYCIYHQPHSRWYAKIKMDIAKGTRWFCSVDDAKAAGCRETRR